ncbi:hypothetical protein IT409_00790 [Candidatus Falkowbacteria bacterium]|nr:hypothetical protein [Candidatus Falkowbacteria bacterium]
MEIDAQQFQMPKNKIWLYDPTLWTLIGSNAYTLVMAITQNWGLSMIMWTYWLQSVIIGVFNVARIVSLKEFSTDGVKMNGSPVENTPATKYAMAGFFAIHFGIFHFVYFIFLLAGVPDLFTDAPQGGMNWWLLLSSTSLFLASHWYSFVYHKPTSTKKPNIGHVMMFPYARIIPMHFTIIFGAFAGWATPLFLTLKTFADVVMHIVHHAPQKAVTLDTNQSI